VKTRGPDDTEPHNQNRTRTEPMKKKVLRFPFPPNATTIVLAMPKGAKITEIGHDPMRGGELAAWALADTEAPTEQRAFYRVCTGETMVYDDKDLTYVARAIALGASTSNPGHMTPRTVHFFEATGDARDAILAMAEATAEAV